jgi:hypothetical protein
LHIAKIGDDASTLKMNDGIVLEYLQPTLRKKWNLGLTGDLPGGDYLDLSEATRKELARRVAKYVESHDLDGVFLDTPLEVASGTPPYDAVRLFADIQNAMPEKIVMPNFGDSLTWRGKANWPTDIRNAWGTLAWFAPWHFVQVAFTTRDPLSFIPVLGVAESRLASNKKLVLGIDDRIEAALTCRTALNPEMAAMLAYSHDHPSLFWYYQSDAAPKTGTHAKDYCWNRAIEVIEKF